MDKQIASEVGTAQVTAQAHRSRALQKLRLLTSIEVARWLALVDKPADGT